MRCFFVLRMAWLLAFVAPTVKLSFAFSVTSKRGFKPEVTTSRMGFARLVPEANVAVVEGTIRVVSLVTRDLLLFPSAVASRKDGKLAASTEARVTWASAGMLSAKKKVTADVVAAPPFRIFRLGASFRRAAFPAEA
jgi:hypothetical protein